MSVCIHCHRDPANAEPYCKENPGDGCTYGLRHEVEGELAVQKKNPAKKVPTPDKNLCPKCGLHPKNPVYSSNGCDHLPS